MTKKRSLALEEIAQIISPNSGNKKSCQAYSERIPPKEVHSRSQWIRNHDYSIHHRKRLPRYHLTT